MSPRAQAGNRQPIFGIFGFLLAEVTINVLTRAVLVFPFKSFRLICLFLFFFFFFLLPLQQHFTQMQRQQSRISRAPATKMV